MPRRPPRSPDIDYRDLWPIDPRLVPFITPPDPEPTTPLPRQPRRPGSDTPAPPPPPDIGTPRQLPPDDAFVGPVPHPQPRRPTLPPKAPAPTVTPPTSSPVDGATGRYFPRGRAAPRIGVLNRVLGIPGAMAWVLGTLVFGPYFGTTRDYQGELERPSTSGPPRRRGRVTTPTVPAPRPWPDDPFLEPLPRFPGTGLPIPLPRRTPSAPGTLVDASTRPRTLPPRPRTVPRTGTPVQTVPSPNDWTLGDPLPGPGYDPFTRAPAPAPAPRAAPRARPGTRRVGFPVQLPWSLPGVEPRSVPRTNPRPLTPQQPRAQPRTPTLPRPPELTPAQDPVPVSLAQPQRKPTQSNPCTTERTARRRRQKDCKKFTTKTIRVCAD